MHVLPNWRAWTGTAYLVHQKYVVFLLQYRESLEIQ